MRFLHNSSVGISMSGLNTVGRNQPLQIGRGSRVGSVIQSTEQEPCQIYCQ